MARHQLEAVNSARGLAYYRVGGRLHEADDPAVRAAGLLADDTEAVAVVHDEAQERDVREALARLASPPPPAVGLEQADPWTGRIVRADPAYDSRLLRRQEWLKAMGPDQWRGAHLPEPGAIPRAYVVAAEPWASDALTRAVSVAAESHLVVPHLRPGLASRVEAEAAEIKAAQHSHARQRSREQAERGREHAYGRYAGWEAQAGAGRAPAHEMER